MSVQHRILCCGSDKRLLETREWILEKHFEVIPVDGPIATAALPDGQTFDLVVLCYSLSGKAYDDVVEIARRRWPGAKILTLWTGIAEPQRPVADDSFDAFFGPQAFLSKINEMLGLRTEAHGRPTPLPSRMASQYLLTSTPSFRIYFKMRGDLQPIAY